MLSTRKADRCMDECRPLLTHFAPLLHSQAILHNMQVECKCHGVSGSCELRTCWKVMPPFRRVGTVLKERFDGATEVCARLWGRGGGLQANQDKPRPVTVSPKEHERAA